MFFFQRQSEAVDDGAENLEELCDAVVTLRLVDEPVKDVVDLFPDVQFHYMHVHYKEFLMCNNGNIRVVYKCLLICIIQQFIMS